MDKLTVELTRDQLSVVIEALARFDDRFITAWELDGIESGEDKADYLYELTEQLEQVA